MNANKILIIMLSACSLIARLAVADEPNIIFILTDDLGYSDVSYYGATKVVSHG